MRRLFRLILGSVLILLGLAGLVLPFLQGWLFLGLGAIVLSRDVPLFARMAAWIEERFPRVGKMIGRLRRYLP